MRQRQEQKREIAGGFKDGLVLLETRNPSLTKTDSPLFDALHNADTRDHTYNAYVDEREVIKLSHAVDKWNDRRDHELATEVILNLLVPIVRDSWTENTSETVIDSDSGDVVRAKITGKRQGSKLEIELSIFSQQRQLKLL